MNLTKCFLEQPRKHVLLIFLYSQYCNYLCSVKLLRTCELTSVDSLLLGKHGFAFLCDSSYKMFYQQITAQPCFKCISISGYFNLYCQFINTELTAKSAMIHAFIRLIKTHLFIRHITACNVPVRC